MIPRAAENRPRALPVARSLLAILMFAQGCSSEPRFVQVFAAAGTKPAVQEAAERFQSQNGTPVRVSYGGAGEVLARMTFAKLGDVYIAPEQRFMDRALDEGTVEPDTVTRIACMVPVLAVQKGNPQRVTTIADLARPGIRVAITRPETTCLGRLAPEIFRREGLEEQIERNVVTKAARPDLLITWLALGEVDAVITWHFYGAVADGEIEVVPLRREQTPGIGEVQAAVTSYSNNRELARSFVRYLSAEAGRAVFRKHGYLVGSEELERYWTAPERRPLDATRGDPQGARQTGARGAPGSNG